MKQTLLNTEHTEIPMRGRREYGGKICFLTFTLYHHVSLNHLFFFEVNITYNEMLRSQVRNSKKFFRCIDHEPTPNQNTEVVHQCQKVPKEPFQSIPVPL